LGHEDTALKERLKSMKCLQGVLTWAIEGAKRWYQRGLHTPPVLNEKLREARMELDTVQHWLDSETEPDARSFLPNSMIRASYERWCEENGVRPLSMIHLGRTLNQLEGLVRDRQDGKRGVLGIKLRYREEEWR
jgi:putative DNA primase/helicase